MAFFVFINQRALAIEERATVWHDTLEPGDAYPAISIVLSENKNRFEAEADLDTGAVDCYGALELLRTHRVVKIKPKEPRLSSQHLSLPYFYFIKYLWLELTDATDTSRKCRAMVICVENWQTSPFTAINPTRTFLLGRSVLLELQPRLILDFAAKRTEV